MPRIFAIGDLHMEGDQEKSMDRFGWVNHLDRIFSDWRQRVSEDDTVLLLGDLSWAMKWTNVQNDLKRIDALPGNKILLKGNHDYWWSTVTKMQSAYPNLTFLHNNYAEDELAVYCGTRGWLCPNDTYFSEDDDRIYRNEALRLERSLKLAKTAGADKRRIALLHYPPTNDRLEPSLFTELFERYEVDEVLYGHLHGKDSFAMGRKGMHNGIFYRLVSCDYLDFRLADITDAAT